MDIETLKRLAEEALAEEVYPNPMFPPSKYYRFLKLLAHEMQPKLSVELGVCGGGGSLHLALGWSEGKVIGVDLVPDHEEHIEYMKKNYYNFEFWIQDSVEAAPFIFRDEGKVKIDILFIDTTHTYERTLNEFKAYKPFLSKRAVVCFDDLFRPGMEEAWDKMPGEKVRLDVLHDGQYPEGGGFGAVLPFKNVAKSTVNS